uniref:Chromatin associated protein KTI12 n=1 Tax=Rhodosorus marinus TaxID=101924 RepID=A0A7S0G5C6_9RHOD|mmetsp:Transcript_20727/g.30063  ORF Transcript_20727/g.30063 Transcript_20727/m.30063 type:complete len:289 (+) Transcript_20727:204-1070(+)
MPLVVVCGVPASGKSTFSRLLYARLKNLGKHIAHIVSDDDGGLPRNEMYRNSAAEKQTRSLLKASIQRKLTSQTVVIADSLNYIKGFRYELFCVAREAGTQLVLVFCNTTTEESALRNEAREQRGEDSYGIEILNGLHDRFEMPTQMNRWERPMFIANNTGKDQDSFGIELDEVIQSIFDQKRALRPNQATSKPEVANTDAIQILDRAMNGVEKSLTEKLPYAEEGDQLVVPPARKRLLLMRTPTTAEIRRHRRAYLKLANLHPPTGRTLEQVADEFVEHLNEQLRTR